MPRAAMALPLNRSLPRQLLMLGLAGAAACAPALAEKADRTKPMTLESDPGQPCVVNLVKRSSQCSGNVAIAQGTLLIRADKVETRETPDGFQMALALGTAAKPAQYRQKRDNVDEYIEATARKIDYDGKAGLVKFEGAAVVRTLRGATVTNEVQGELVSWDSVADEVRVQGGAVTPTNPTGRTRAMITPPPPASAASAPARPASVTLRSTPTLGDRR